MTESDDITVTHGPELGYLGNVGLEFSSIGLEISTKDTIITLWLLDILAEATKGNKHNI